MDGSTKTEYSIAVSECLKILTRLFSKAIYTFYCRNTIEALFPNQIKKRIKNSDNNKNNKTQQEFEKKCKSMTNTLNHHADNHNAQINFNNNNNNNHQQPGFFQNLRNPNRLVTIISFLSGLFVGILISAAILLGFFFIWYLNNTYATHSVVNKYMKPTYLWDEKETHEWLQQLGPWSLAQIAPIANRIKLSK